MPINFFRTILRDSEYMRRLRSAPPGTPHEEILVHERNRRLVWSALGSVICKGVTAFVGVISVPMVIHAFGKEQYGLWMIVSSLVVWMQLADFGVTNGLTNALSEAFGRDDLESARGYIQAALLVTVGLCLTAIPLFWILFGLLDWGSLLNIQDQAQLAFATQAFLLVGIAFLINVPMSLSARALTAFQRGYILHFVQIGVSVACLVGYSVVIYLNAGMLWLVAISSFLPLLGNLYLWFFLPACGISGLRFDALPPKSHILRVFDSSVPLFVFQIGALLVNQLVNLLIARLASLALVADYNVIQRMYLFVFSLSAGISAPFYVAIRESLERRDQEWARLAVGRSLRIRLLVLVPFVLLFLVAGSWVLEVWLGKSGAPAIGVLDWGMVTLCLVLASISSLLSEALQALDEIWEQVLLVFVSAIVSISSMVFLIAPLGVGGVYLSMAFSTLIPIAWSWRRLRGIVHEAIPGGSR